MSILARKKIVFVIVEGPSDQDALHKSDDEFRSAFYIFCRKGGLAI